MTKLKIVFNFFESMCRYTIVKQPRQDLFSYLSQAEAAACGQMLMDQTRTRMWVRWN